MRRRLTSYSNVFSNVCFVLAIAILMLSFTVLFIPSKSFGAAKYDDATGDTTDKSPKDGKPDKGNKCEKDGKEGKSDGKGGCGLDGKGEMPMMGMPPMLPMLPMPMPKMPMMMMPMMNTNPCANVSTFPAGTPGTRSDTNGCIVTDPTANAYASNTPPVSDSGATKVTNTDATTVKGETKTPVEEVVGTRGKEERIKIYGDTSAQLDPNAQKNGEVQSLGGNNGSFNGAQSGFGGGASSFSNSNSFSAPVANALHSVGEAFGTLSAVFAGAWGWATSGGLTSLFFNSK